MVETEARYPAPHALDEETLEDICATAAVPLRLRPKVKNALSDLIAAFADAIKTQGRVPDARDDRKAIGKAIGKIGKLRDIVTALGPAGRRSMRAFGPKLGPAVSAEWLRARFPGDSSTPGQHALHEHRGGRLPQREPMRGGRFDIEQRSLDDRVDYVARRPSQTVDAMLAEIERALRASLEVASSSPEAKGGRPRLVRQEQMLEHLALLWREVLGRPPTGGDRSEFVAFCGNIFSEIGWPADGVESKVSRLISAEVI